MVDLTILLNQSKLDKVYKADTEPLIDFYKEFNDVVTINALGDIEEIYKTIEADLSMLTYKLLKTFKK